LLRPKRSLRGFSSRIYVQRMIVGAPYEKKIEFTTTREREAV
jgi:hypothetical protein